MSDENLNSLIAEAVAVLGDREWTISVGNDFSHFTPAKLNTASLMRTILSVEEGKKADGKLWSPFTFKNNHRMAANALHAEFMVMDLDLGYSREDLIFRLEMAGLAGVIIPSPSHGTTTSQEAPAWRFDEWKRETGQGSIQTFMVDDKWMLSALASTIQEVETVTVEKPRTTTSGATTTETTDYLKITHGPRPKYRVILPLAAPWDAGQDDHKAAEARWREAYRATADLLDVVIDEATTDTARLFYLSRMPQDKVEPGRADRGVVEGSPLDVSKLPKPKLPRPGERPERKNPNRPDRSRSKGGIVVYTDETGTAYNLTKWAASHASEFQIVDALKEHGNALLDERGEHGGKLHIICPFEDEHTATNGGTIAVNAKDGKGFSVYCQHNACNGRGAAGSARDRLEFLGRMLELDWLALGQIPGIKDSLVTKATISDFEAVDIDELFHDSSTVKKETAKQGLFYVEFHDMKVDLGSVSMVQGLLDPLSMSVLYGQSNSGKTFVAADIAFSIASGRPWAGKRVQQGAVVYVAAEGARSMGNRLEALRRKYETPKCPFFTVPCQVDLLSKDGDTDKLIELVRGIEKDKGVKVDFLVVDTLSRALAGGNENDSADMGSFVKSLDRIRYALRLHMMVIHHSGKDTAKGARGHSLLRAATDTEIEINEKTLQATKQRDMESGPAMQFELEVIELGSNPYGEPVTSCTLGWMDAPEEMCAELVLTERERFMLGAFKDAVIDAHKEGINFITLAKWKDKIKTGDISGLSPREVMPSSEDGFKKAFYRGRDKLLKRGDIGSIQENQWVLRSGDKGDKEGTKGDMSLGL